MQRLSESGNLRMLTPSSRLISSSEQCSQTTLDSHSTILNQVVPSSSACWNQLVHLEMDHCRNDSSGTSPKSVDATMLAGNMVTVIIGTFAVESNGIDTICDFLSFRKPLPNVPIVKLLGPPPNDTFVESLVKMVSGLQHRPTV